jgi:hypothetical protein
METKQVILRFLASLVLTPSFSSAQPMDLEPQKDRPSASGNATVVFRVLPTVKDGIQ